MTSAKYRTLGDELTEGADLFQAHFITHGYRVKVEHTASAFPRTPAFVCVRKPTTLVLEIDSRVKREYLNNWIVYAQSCPTDTRIALGLTTGKVSKSDEAMMRKSGIGLFMLNRMTVYERIVPIDLALQLSLTPIEDLPPKLRRLLGEAYEQIARSNWREGFQSACEVLETEACKYLKFGWRKKRLVILERSGLPAKLTAAKIERMTLGDLATSFENIQNRNSADDMIGIILRELQNDRNRVTHKKKHKRTEKSLRDHFALHMLRIIKGLGLIVSSRSK